MIQDHDRSGYFGASDVSFIMARNLNTPTFRNWWMTKIGMSHNGFESISMNAGTNKEHQILDSLGIPMTFDRQIIIEDIKLRVNLDGDNGIKIFECKTHKAENPYKCPLNHKRQVNVQMFASGLQEAEIVSYGLLEEDYNNYFLPIDRKRRKETPVKYDKQFLSDFEKRITWFADCLRKGVMPQ